MLENGLVIQEMKEILLWTLQEGYEETNLCALISFPCKLHIFKKATSESLFTIEAAVWFVWALINVHFFLHYVLENGLVIQEMKEILLWTLQEGYEETNLCCFDFFPMQTYTSSRKQPLDRFSQQEQDIRTKNAFVLSLIGFHLAH